MERQRRNAFTQRFNDLLTLTGKSAYEVAELSGLDHAYVHRLKTGEKHPSAQTVARLTIGLTGNRALFRRHPELVDAFAVLLRAMLDDDLGVS